MFVTLRNTKPVSSSDLALNTDILIEDGVIADIGENLPCPGRVIDCHGKTLLPAFVDLHTHFRDPGFTHKEDILSGCRAAVHGGYTTVNLMANTKPVCSSMETVRYVREKAQAAGICDVYQTVSITKDFDGKTLSHIRELDEPVLWLSDDGVGVPDTAVMLKAMALAKERGLGVMLHEEDPALTMHNMYAAEEVMTYRDVKLALLTGCRTHFCHVSTIDALDAILAGKKAGANITCEVSPHHLTLNDSTHYNVAPPLRAEKHRQYLVKCLAEGKIDAIATDHAPHTPEDKKNGANGITGLDLAFATCYTHLVRTGALSLAQLSRLLSAGPATLLGIYNKGRIEPGFLADLVLVDLDEAFTVTESHIASRGKNTPMLGKTLYGQVLMTMKQGEIVYEKMH